MEFLLEYHEQPRIFAGRLLCDRPCTGPSGLSAFGPPASGSPVTDRFASGQRTEVNLRTKLSGWRLALIRNLS